MKAILLIDWVKVLKLGLDQAEKKVHLAYYSGGIYHYGMTSLVGGSCTILLVLEVVKLFFPFNEEV